MAPEQRRRLAAWIARGLSRFSFVCPAGQAENGTVPFRTIALAAVAALAVLAAAAAAPAAKPAAGPPPLVVDRSAPALLSDGPAKFDSSQPAGHPKADNGPCFVCHGNFQDESLAVTHAKAGVGCMKCHGPSLAHRSDEDNVTPPEIMYPAAKIDAACRKCHEEHDASAREVIARWQKRCPGKTDAARIVCTDCHGEHHMQVRTVHWDKETGAWLGRPGAGKRPPPATPASR